MCVYLHAYPREPPQMSLKTLLSVEELQVIFPSVYHIACIIRNNVNFPRPGHSSRPLCTEERLRRLEGPGVFSEDANAPACLPAKRA